MAKKAKKKCCKPNCMKNTASPRARFCTVCFRKNASLASLQRKTFSGGGGVPGNSGNFRTRQKSQKGKTNGKRSALQRPTMTLLDVLYLVFPKSKYLGVRNAQMKQQRKTLRVLNEAAGVLIVFVY